jgi:FtsZ-interacting cell division protein ZipA
MSDFQLSLVLIGALVIIGVFAFNKWQEYRAKRSTDQTFKSAHRDVLIGGENGSRGNPGSGEDLRIEPGLAPRSTASNPRGADEAAHFPLPDPRVDYVIELAAEEPVKAASLYERWGNIEHRFSRRASLSGWTDRQWKRLPGDASCREFQAALQLVSRQGVVSEAEVLEFRSGVETLASRLQLAVTAPEMRDALDAARVLDKMCAEADIQVAFHVVAQPGAAFTGTKVRAAAEASGFTLDSEGRFRLSDENGRELYSLSDRSGARFSTALMKDTAPQALTLTMDVPRAPETQKTFDAMVRFGRNLANLLGGGLVDDNNQPLDERAVSTINTQLTVVRRNLEAHGIAPGSPLALRLFS